MVCHSHLLPFAKVGQDSYTSMMVVMLETKFRHSDTCERSVLGGFQSGRRT